MANETQHLSHKPLSVKRIAVWKLFGSYSYNLPSPDDPSKDISNFFILYGDNGSGKTTILRLVFHLLGHEDNRGHRTFLAQTRFSKFLVELENGITISAERASGMLIGSYMLRVSDSFREIAACQVTADENNIVRTNVKQMSVLREFLAHLRNLKVAVYYLSDDRKITGGWFYAPVEEDEFLTTMRAFRSRHAEALHARRLEQSGAVQELEIERVIHGAEEWIRQQVYRGSRVGQEGANTIYANVISRIAGLRNEKKAEAKSTRDSLASTLKTLIDRNNEFCHFGITAPMKPDEFLSPLRRVNESKLEIISDVLAPYSRGLETRLDALQEIKNLISIFLGNINSFFTDKQITYQLREGIRIFSSSKEILQPKFLSSGERQLVLLFCTVVSARSAKGIFIIDEPELSLNVKWQRRLLKSLLECIQGSSIQFVLATHSLELISQYRNSVVKLESSRE